MKLNDRACCIILNPEKDKILLMWRFRNGEEYYIFPGGTNEEGESIEETLIREAFEELNLKIEIDKLLFKSFNQEFHQRYDNYFLIKKYEGNFKLGDPELSSQNRQNIYRPEWVELSKLNEINLKPEYVVEELIEKINSIID